MTPAKPKPELNRLMIFAFPRSIQQANVLDYLKGLSFTERTEWLGEIRETQQKEKSFPAHYATILTLVAGGLSNKKIAEELDLTERTIKNYLSIIYQILGTNNRTQAVIVATRRGLIGENDE